MKDEYDIPTVHNSTLGQETIEKQYIPESWTDPDNNLHIVVEDLNEEEENDKTQQKYQKRRYTTGKQCCIDKKYLENAQSTSDSQNTKPSYEEIGNYEEGRNNIEYQNSEEAHSETNNVNSSNPLNTKKHGLFWNIINEQANRRDRKDSQKVDIYFSDNFENPGNAKKPKFSKKIEDTSKKNEGTAPIHKIKNNIKSETTNATHEIIYVMKSNRRNNFESFVERQIGVEKVPPVTLPNLPTTQLNVELYKDNCLLGNNNALRTHDCTLPIDDLLLTQNNQSTENHAFPTQSYPVPTKINPSIPEDIPPPARDPPPPYPGNAPRRLNILGRNLRSIPFYQDRTLRFQATRDSPYGQGGGERRGNDDYLTYEEELALFDDPDIRRQFIILVMFILTLQLAASFGFIILCLLLPNLRLFVARQVALAGAAIAIEIFLMFTLYCCKGPRSKFPINYILLTIFTAAFGYCIAFCVVRYKVHIIVGSMGVTALICLIVTILAIFLPFDMTKYGMYLGIAFTVLILIVITITILALLGLNVHFVFTIICYLIAGVLIIAIWYDIQLIMGGHRMMISPDEPIIAAMALYIDIMTLFLYIVQIWQSCSE